MNKLAFLFPELPPGPKAQPLDRELLSGRANADANRLDSADRSAHGWYRFVLSFPPHLVRDYLHRFEAGQGAVCLDPFCGTGTTLVECKKLGIPSVGVESHPMSFFAAKTKVDWTPDPAGLLEHAEEIAQSALTELQKQGISDAGKNPNFRASDLRQMPVEAASLLLAKSISPLPLHKTLMLLDKLRARSGSQYHRHELLALAQALVSVIGNLHFGPEVGVGPAKLDAPVVTAWLRNVRVMSSDLSQLRSS